MRNFLKIATGLDVFPLLHAIQTQPELWNEDRTRQTFDNSPHTEVDDILVRFGDPAAPNVGDTLIADWRNAATFLPQVRPIVFSLMARLEAEQLGRVVITRLASGKKIAPHADVLGRYSQWYSRYHVVLQSYAGAYFECGGEAIEPHSGDVWWVDASKIHAVHNDSEDDRIHMLVDLKVTR